MRPLNHQYADRFIRENYDELSAKFRVLDSKLAERGCSALDKLNDTMLSLYDNERTYKGYSQFEKWAADKFTEKEKR